MRDLMPYFRDLLRLLVDADPGAILVEEESLDERNNHSGGLQARIRYTDGSTLNVRVWTDCSGEWPRWISYGFHYRDAERRQRFRYDNAPHRPELINFPHHLHLGESDAVLPLGPPSLRGVADAVRWHLAHPGETWFPAKPA